MDLAKINAILDNKKLVRGTVKNHRGGSPLLQSSENEKLANSLQHMFSNAEGTSTPVMAHFTTLPPMF